MQTCKRRNANRRDEEGKEEVLTFDQSSTSMVFKDRTKVNNANVQIHY